MLKNYCFILMVFCICAPSNAQIYFKESAADLNLEYSCGYTPWGNGITFHDYNNDGWDDITLNTESGNRLQFFKNTNGSFSEEFLLNPPISYQTKQVNWVDIDNDGDKDLFVTSDTQGNRLFENTGGMNMLDITVAAGLPSANMYTYGASWGDYNNDGYLDVYVSNRDEVTFTTPNFLYRNNGNGTFTDVSSTVGLHTTAHSSFCSAFFDFNNDGYQDLFVANDRSIYENFMYKNNGDGTFSDVGSSSGAGIIMDAMSATIGDFNHDGWFDIYVTNTSSGNVFLRNNGNETFTDIAVTSGTSFNAIAWGSVFLDVDNDMDLDLYVSGMLDGVNPSLIPYAFYENNNDNTFSEPLLTGFEIDNRSSFSNAIGDYNNDGKFDIAVANNDDTNIFLWKNETTTTNNWLKIKLEGTTSNKDGIGSVIEIGINGEKQFRYMLCGEGYLSQNSESEIFGLGTNTSVDYVKVTWLSGIQDVLYNVNANQTIDLVEGTATLSNPQAIIDNDIRLYPNPSPDHMFLESSNPIIAVTVYDLIGQKIVELFPNRLKIRLDMSEYQAGIYMIETQVGEKIKIFKAIKE